MGILSWIVFGAVAGWIASLVAGRDKGMGCMLNIITGIVGAFIGGALMQFLTRRSFEFGFDLRSFAVAVLGSLILLALVRAARKK